MKRQANPVAYWDLRETLLKKIADRGGWVNCHAHIDRAYTINQENMALSNKLRSEKWLLNSELRKTSTVDQIYDRMARATEMMLEQGTQALGSFIDVDGDVKDKGIRAAQRLRDQYGSDLTLKFMNQSSYGLFTMDKASRHWFEIGAEFVDIIGGLLKADQGREAEHLDILLGTAKALGKMLHIHIDELNLPEEHETELLAQKTIEHGMQGRVVGIHGISINARPETERQKIYQLAKEAGLMFVSCPVSWLNSRRSESLTPIHNPITPVDEMLAHGITVGLGTDNIADIWMPFNNADLWLDLRVLLEAARIHDLDVLADIASSNGQKILGLEPVKVEETPPGLSSVTSQPSTTPFYDPAKSYEDNYRQGPFGAFKNRETVEHQGRPQATFLGQKIYQPFGIPAGPLLNSKFVAAAFRKGFDINVYKTVRTRSYPSHPWPNVLSVKLQGDLTLKKAAGQLIASHDYQSPLSITNSFGVPSMDPDIWQADMAKAVKSAGPGQVMIGSFQGTKKQGGTAEDLINDYVLAARLVKETGAKIIEANLSCPNEGTADLLCFDTDRVAIIAEKIKNEVGNTPLIIKLGYFTNQVHLRNYVQKIGPLVDGMSVINTIAAAVVDEQGQQALPGEGRLRSGVCGSGIKWAGLEMVERLAALRAKYELDFAIIGVGGVTQPSDYAEYRQAGADGVMSATGAMWDPELAVKIMKATV